VVVPQRSLCFSLLPLSFIATHTARLASLLSG
jgi:hypothetical protein